MRSTGRRIPVKAALIERMESRNGIHTVETAAALGLGSRDYEAHLPVRGDGGMKYRTLGRTGLLVSEIGMGCEGFVGKSRQTVREFIDRMEAAGINCIDLYSPDPDFRSNLGGGPPGTAGEICTQAHLCTIWKDGQYKFWGNRRGAGGIPGSAAAPGHRPCGNWYDSLCGLFGGLGGGLFRPCDGPMPGS